ncbi:MAG: sulfite reductase [NADPH] flavoprotein alpha-component [Alphaproteobacteria bacterium CG11_big_fil_rev_8_21_14_0_20_44_7]|nr:MAG: sulfite reductase [NADPH] flavoprotein alpha-component [Alphaproteobacteria bacterium CG11_big_fil_rev_8_21_14_0_20_44_7]
MDIPENTPLSPAQKKLLEDLLKDAKPELVGWLAGYFGHLQKSMPIADSGGAKTPLYILFGTESGNTEELAANAAKSAKKLGFAPKLLDFADIEPADLEKYENLIVYISTWGEGDPPERVEAFDKAFKSAKPDMSKIQFGICALGDTSYTDFCEMGKKYDKRFEELGATRFFDRVDLDVDYHDGAQEWTDNILKKFVTALGVEPAAAMPSYDFGEVEAKTYSGKDPFTAKLKEKLVLNGTGSIKETWHAEIDLSGSGIRYQVGDALGIVPKNDPKMVEEIMQATGVTEIDLHEYDINALTKPVIEKYAEITGDKGVAKLLDGDLQEYIWGREVIDLLTEFPHKLKSDQLKTMLRKLPPRLYSISSSQAAVGDEVHLTIAAVRYNSHGRDRKGVASTYIADLVANDEDVNIYLKPNKNFRLPESGDVPIIMVGPGTGVAPFRAFMQEREAVGAKGRNWLFFGDQHYNYDFLYQLEWQDWYKSGLLSRMDVAFSRDKPQKVYVQDRMWERKKEIYDWLESGGYFYVCGDEKRMAKDVDAMLKKIVSEVGNVDGEEYIAKLRKEKRYLRDVY